MKKILIVIMLSLTASLAEGQFNLVQNASFEDTIFGTQCYCQGDIELCVKKWFNPHGATPDYYTYFPGYCSGVSSVNNTSGFQLARTGNAYAGIYGFVSPNRDYIAIKLTDSLIHGRCYYSEFYISLADLSMYAIDNLGCFFTNDTSGFKSFYTNIPETPQMLNQQGNFLSDTLNWQKISGSFTAFGGETFLIIGNFFDDANTALDTVNSGTTWQVAYYYIDDVLVTPCDSLTGIFTQTSSNIHVFPIPTSNIIYVLEDKSIENLKLMLFDMKGVELTRQVSISKNTNGWQIDISNLSNGIYLLKYSGRQNLHAQYKIIKQ
jgi:hypothetical protein